MEKVEWRQEESGERRERGLIGTYKTVQGRTMRRKGGMDAGKGCQCLLPARGIRPLMGPSDAQSIFITHGFHTSELTYLLKFIVTPNSVFTALLSFMDMCREAKNLTCPRCVLFPPEAETGNTAFLSQPHTGKKCPFPGLLRSTFFTLSCFSLVILLFTMVPKRSAKMLPHFFF